MIELFLKLFQFGKQLIIGFLCLFLSHQSLNAYSQNTIIPDKKHSKTGVGRIDKYVLPRSDSEIYVPDDNGLELLEPCDTTFVVSVDSFTIDLVAGTGSDVTVLANNPTRMSKIAACVKIETSGFYRILTTTKYGDETQTDESFFLEILNGGGDATYPCDPNAGIHKVVVDDDGKLVKTLTRNAGVFYFDTGNHIILLNHFILIAKDFFQFVNDTTYFVNNDSTFSGPQSVHLRQLTLELTNERPDLALSKSVSKDSVNPSDEFSYILRIDNIGSAPAHKIELWDEIPDSVTLIQNSFNLEPSDVVDSDVLFWTFDSLAPGDQIDIEYKAKVAGMFLSLPYKLESFSQVNALCDTNTANNEVRTTVTVIENADLAITKTVSPDTVLQGEDFKYTLKVENLGPDDAIDIHLWDALPEFVTLLESTPSPLNMASSDTLKWQFDSLAAGDSLIVRIRAIVSDSIDIFCSVFKPVNISWVISAFDINSTNNRDSTAVYIVGECPPEYDLELKKSVSRDTIFQEEEFTYTIKILNHGPDAASEISLWDALPEFVTLLESTPTPLNTASSDTLKWQFDALAAGDSLNVLIKVIASDSIDISCSAFKPVNKSWVISAFDMNTANNRDSTAVYIVGECPPEYDLELKKSVNRDTIFQEEEFTYSIKVLNHGPDAASEISLWDALPEFVTLLESTPNPLNTASSDTLNWKFDSLGAGDSLNVRIKAIVSDSIDISCSAFKLVNKSWVISAFDINTTNNRDSTAVYIVGECPQCDIELTKSVNIDAVSQGDEFVYELKIVNRGTIPVRNIALWDTRPDYVYPIKSTLEPSNPIDSDTLFWVIDSLNVAESVTIAITASVPCNVDIPFFPFEQVNYSWVFAECDVNELNNQASATVKINDACNQNYDLELSKSVTPDTVFQGQEFTYNLKIVNRGPRPAYEFVLWDAVPNMVTPIKFTIEPSNPFPADTLRWKFDSLARNDSVIIEFTAMISTSIVLPEYPFTVVNTSFIAAAHDTNAQNDLSSGNVVCLRQPQDECIVLDQNVFEPEKGEPLAITFELSSNSPVSIKLYDISGQHITNLVEKSYSKGQHTYFWDGLSEKGLKVGSGVYLIVFRSIALNCIEKVIVAL